MAALPTPSPIVWIGAAVAAAALATASLSGAAAQPAGAPAPAGEAARGAMLYAQRCSACHSIDANRIGPAHRGIVGRHAARAPGFDYSPALQRLDLTWTPANLDRWLRGPTAMAPGTSMGTSVPAAQDRADIIAYLQTQGAPH